MATPWHAHLLKVFFSNKYVYASVLHKTSPRDPGRFVAHASSLQRALRAPLAAAERPASDRAASAEVGRLLAERARAAGGFEAVHFERRRGQRYAGKLKALIEAIRANGLQVK
ncbi:MAG: translational machinery component [Monoraphidium minutum]|nr:MAG: translational machinery component [Monoraphidium minutum]